MWRRRTSPYKAESNSRASRREGVDKIASNDIRALAFPSHLCSMECRFSSLSHLMGFRRGTRSSRNAHYLSRSSPNGRCQSPHLVHSSHLLRCDCVLCFHSTSDEAAEGTATSYF